MDLSKQPVYCFTSDLDWAPESMIKELMDLFKDTPLTPFVTHHSRIIEENYRGEKKKYVGVHPNFLPGSTHGDSITQVVTSVMKIWPDTCCFRSHSFFDHYYVGKEFYNWGIEYDSNLCLHLQSNIIPLRHVTGLLRFPVFLQDNHYTLREGVWDISHIEDVIDTPGLKIFNFHPIHIALNTPDMEYYESVKETVKWGDWRDYVNKGKGVRTFLVDLIKLVKQKPGAGIYYLDDIYSILTGTTISEKYDQSTIDQRLRAIKDRYNALDGSKTYATSRDFNMRELEIDFILSHIQNNTRILDIGCGNGYTDIRIAKERNVEIIGVDFSEEMLKGAESLRKGFKDELVGDVTFQLGDVRKLEWWDDYFDVVISERCLLNMPNREAQYRTILEVYRVLKEKGIFIMVEGTRDGLRRLNNLRVRVGLDPIPDRMEDNITSLKFEEEELELFLTKHFKIIRKQYFGTYYLISRVIHPLLVAPKQPSFDAEINTIAREVAKHGLDYNQLGHLVGYVLEKIE